MREQIHSNWGGSWCCFVKFPPWFSFRPLGENQREVPRGQNWEKRNGEEMMERGRALQATACWPSLASL